MSKHKKFLFLNTSDTGGLANNIYKMHNALLNNGYDSILIVKNIGVKLLLLKCLLKLL